MLVMKRPLLFMERVLYGDGTKPFHGVFTLKIRGTLTAAGLRQALANIQARHPMLRVTVQEDEKGKHWFVTPPVLKEIPVRVVQRRGEDDWIKESVNEWATLFDTSGPLVRLVWLRSEKVSDILITIHHCVFDGGSVLAMARELLVWLDEPGKEILSYQPFTTVRDLVPAAVWNSRGLRFKGWLAAILAQAFVPLKSRMLPATLQAPLQRGRDYLVHWKLDKDISAALNRYCVTHHLSTHTAMATAFLMAFAEVKGAHARGKLDCPVDIRPFVKEIRRDHLFAFGLSVSLSIKYKQGMNFWATVKKMQACMSAGMDRLNGHAQLMMYENFHPVLKPLLRCLTYGKVVNDAMFSNLGRLDIPKTYRSFEVETVYSPSVLGPFNNPTTILTSVFRGQMDFSFISSQDFLSYESAMAIKEKAMQLLTGSLPVAEAIPAALTTNPEGV
jgi:NRPS condensation-like uncharacterized protein